MIDIDLDFLGELEGYETKGYVPGKGKKSGVTIGIGIDLGQQSEKGLLDAGLTPDTVRKLKPYLGLKGDSARAKLKKHPLVLDDETTKYITRNVINDNIDKLREKFNKGSDTKFEDLTRAQQTVVFSVTHQYGLDGAPKFFRKAQGGKWNAVKDELLNFVSKEAIARGVEAYPTRRKKEADFLSREEGREEVPRVMNPTEEMQPKETTPVIEGALKGYPG